MLTSNNVNKFRLARYAAEYWTQHVRAVENDVDRINQLSIELFQLKNDAYINWIRLFDLNMPWNGLDMTRTLENVASLIYYASLAGLVEPARLLLEKGPNINAQGGLYGNALQAASAEGHKAVVGLLLEKGADQSHTTNY
jgi:ankyrin repeat protein